jgi:hypothetical protein
LMGARGPRVLVDKIIIVRHPSKIDKDGRRHYIIRHPVPRSSARG